MLKKFEINGNLWRSIFVFGILFFSQNAYASTISGIVYDNQRNPLIEVDVELLDDYYRQVNHTRTSASGRYEFGGLIDGRYTVKVMPFRYDLIDESALVEIATVVAVQGGQSNAYMTQDFYLTPRRGSLAETETGVVFAQEVPKEAEKLCNTALKDLSKKKTEEGIAGLRKAVGVFPNYYLALHSLGKEFFLKGEYGAALQALLKASEINLNSPTNYYYLGYTLSKLNYNKAAMIPLNKALTLAPSSVQVLYILGVAENSEGKYTEAEKHLVQAKKLAKVVIPDIYWQLAQIYGNKLKRYKEAADELELYLKAEKFDDVHTAKIKKVISDLREKAKKPS